MINQVLFEQRTQVKVSAFNFNTNLLYLQVTIIIDRLCYKFKET